jgi:DNA-binding transcriptional LysR family regulator
VLLESTNRRVDVIREGFDLAIRVRFPPLEDSDLDIRKLADSPQRLVASPSVSKAFLQPLVPADLESLPSLGLNPAGLIHEWQLDGPGGATTTISHRPRFATEDMMALRLAALRGIGVCQFPTFSREGLLFYITLSHACRGERRSAPRFGGTAHNRAYRFKINLAN